MAFGQTCHNKKCSMKLFVLLRKDIHAYSESQLTSTTIPFFNAHYNPSFINTMLLYVGLNSQILCHVLPYHHLSGKMLDPPSGHLLTYSSFCLRFASNIILIMHDTLPSVDIQSGDRAAIYNLKIRYLI
jgi:hypothetical protein